MKKWGEGLYIHLGDDFVVSTREIVAIFDYKAKTSPIVEEFLSKQKQRIVSSNSTPKSIVVTLQSIYFSLKYRIFPLILHWLHLYHYGIITGI